MKNDFNFLRQLGRVRVNEAKRTTRSISNIQKHIIAKKNKKERSCCSKSFSRFCWVWESRIHPVLLPPASHSLRQCLMYALGKIALRLHNWWLMRKCEENYSETLFQSSSSFGFVCILDAVNYSFWSVERHSSVNRTITVVVGENEAMLEEFKRNECVASSTIYADCADIGKKLNT